MIDALFAFAIEAGGYTEFCKKNECKAPQVVRVAADNPHYKRSRNGHYMNGQAAYVKEREQKAWEDITTVHEFTHHLQHLSNRYQQYRGVCNQYGAEKEAHEVGAKYALTVGWKLNNQATIAGYETKCRAAVEVGLLKKPSWME